MLKKMVVPVIAGAVAFMVLGYLLYELLLGGFYEANLGSATGVMREVPIAWALIISQLGFAALVTYVFLHAGVGSAAAGLKAGAVFGLLLGIAISFDLYGVTNWSNVTVAFVEPLVTTIRTALAGAVIGWALGRG